jgi:hypothetical protein
MTEVEGLARLVETRSFDDLSDQARDALTIPRARRG